MPQAGISALAFDYRNFGESTGKPRQLLDISRQLTDWRSAVAFARTLPSVDPARIGLWGTSLSGGHVIEIAAEDPTIAAVISQSPFVDGPATLREQLSRAGSRAVVRLTLAGARDQLRALAGRPPHLVPVAAAGIGCAAIASRI